jgi:iron(III) transport system ATP-binding protein
MSSATDRLAIRARDLTRYFDDVVALDHFSLDVWESGVVTLLGPSGCGKTTALRVIAGFESARGSIEVHGRTVLDEKTFVPPDKRRVGMVFQDYALFPHMTVASNVGYGLPKGDRAPRVGEVLALVGLSGLEDRMPDELSGGQQQRVALARALAPKPEVILLDEPFSNLDASLRDRVRRELRLILTEARTTAVFVTHDQEEALATSDIVAVMRDGKILQADTPANLYSNPANRWIAEFLGDADVLESEARNGVAETPVGSFKTDLTGKVSVIVRPENIQISLGETSNAVVIGSEFFGHDQLVTVALNQGTSVRARIGPRPIYRSGQACRVRATDARIFAQTT